MRMVNHQIVKADQFYGCHPFVGAVVQVLNFARNLLRERLLDPLPLYGAGQSEQRQILRTPSAHLPNTGSDEQRRVLHHALSHQRTVPSFRQIALQGPLIAPQAELIDEPRHNAPQQSIIAYL